MISGRGINNGRKKEAVKIGARVVIVERAAHLHIMALKGEV